MAYGPRVTQEKLRIAEALLELPETARALEAGGISFSAARELTRVAIASTERDWLEASSGRTVREIEHLVAGHRPGSRPDDAPDPGAKRHVLRLAVSGEVLATFREAMAKVRRDAGEALDDDAAVLLLARSVLEGRRASELPGGAHGLRRVRPRQTAGRWRPRGDRADGCRNGRL